MSDKYRKKIKQTTDALVKTQVALDDIYMQNLLDKTNPAESQFMVEKLKSIRLAINILLGYQS
jgi:hypothetical protein